MNRQKYNRTNARAIERNEARRQGSFRLIRTIVLGVVASVVAIIWLGDQYGIDRQVMLEFLGTSALFVGLLVLSGLVGAVILKLIKIIRGL
ncbi:MAG: hypothetical protein GXP16_07755 [Gammaproteobacteria bacterium]|nr:hypothetical protein [Gammaproteobacteria bacterium]